MNTRANPRPADRVAIVTGGSRGVGRAIVRSLATRGCALVVNYLHDQDAAESMVSMVLARNGEAVAVRADAADELDVERLFAETEWTFGGVDVVVHAVGGRITEASVADLDLEAFDDLCRINMRAALIVDREAARQVREGGAIINLTSSAVRSPRPGYGALAATQAATEAFTRVLALELRARDISVNAVSLQLGEGCVAERVGDTVAYLSGVDGHGLTGQVIPVDGPK